MQRIVLHVGGDFRGKFQAWNLALDSASFALPFRA